MLKVTSQFRLSLTESKCFFLKNNARKDTSHIQLQRTDKFLQTGCPLSVLHCWLIKVSSKDPWVDVVFGENDQGCLHIGTCHRTLQSMLQLVLSMLGKKKNSADILKFFSFFLNTGFMISLNVHIFGGNVRKADKILKYFSLFSRKQDLKFHEMSIFPGKCKKYIVDLSSAEFNRRFRLFPIIFQKTGFNILLMSPFPDEIFLRKISLICCLLNLPKWILTRAQLFKASLA